MKEFFLTILVLLSLSIYSQQSYIDVSASLGIYGQTGLGHAVGWGDIDNDSDPDLIISNQEGDALWFYRNDGETYTDITLSSGVGVLGANKIIFAEVTGDSYDDLILRTRNSTQHLFESNGDGTFNNLSASSGIAIAAVYNIADFNNDGLTDLLSVAGDQVSILYNNGDKTFADPDVISPLNSFYGIAVLDYNADGWMDIYWSTYGNYPNTLLKNNGDGTFTDKTAEAGVEFTTPGHGLDVGDYNNDGYVDVYVGDYSSNRSFCSLFKNNGDGTFEDVSASTGSGGHDDTRTATFTDFNNDGWLDIFSSHHDFYSYSNTMLKSNFGESFEDVATSLDISGEWIGDYFGVGWADHNMDGAMDFFAAGHIDKYNLFENTNCPGSYLMIDLVGVESNPNGIGARVEVWNNGNKLSRFMLPDGGFHDFSHLRLHFGLDGAYSVDSIHVFWPSGIIQKLGGINGNQLITIVEDEVSGLDDDRLLNYSPRILTNPMKDKLEMLLSMKNAGKVSVSVYLLNGQLYYDGGTQYLEKGSNTMAFNTDRMPSGMYLLLVETIYNTFTEKIIKLD